MIERRIFFMIQLRILLSLIMKITNKSKAKIMKMKILERKKIRDPKSKQMI